MKRLQLGMFLPVLLVAGLTVIGCGVDSFRERVCYRGEHPVFPLEHPQLGGACVKDSDPPPSGYATYPPGKTPIYYDQQVRCSDSGQRCGPGPLAIRCPPDFPARPCRVGDVALPRP